MNLNMLYRKRAIALAIGGIYCCSYSTAASADFLGDLNRGLQKLAVSNSTQASPAPANTIDPARQRKTDSRKSTEDECTNTAQIWGTVIGGVLGAVIGNKLGNGKGQARFLGAALGGIAGNLIGADMDRRRCELEKIAKANGVHVEFESIKVSSESTAENIGTADDVGITQDSPQPSASNNGEGKPSDKAGTDNSAQIARWEGLEHF